MIGKRPRVVDEILERLDLLIADRQDEVKHTALVRLEGRGNVLEDECRHRMQRHDALDNVLRSDARLFHHLPARIVQTAVQIPLTQRPIRLCRRLRLERSADQFKGDIVWQSDGNVDETIANLLPRLIRLCKQMIRLMRDRNKEKRPCIDKLRQLLKIRQTLPIDAEIIRELIPDEYDLDLIFHENVGQPVKNAIDVQPHVGKSLIVAKFRDALHEIAHLAALVQTRQNIRRCHGAEQRRPLRLLQLAVHEDPIRLVLLQPTDDAVLQRVLALVKTSHMQSRLHALLHSDQKIARRLRRSRIAVHRHDAFAFPLESQQLSQQIPLLLQVLVLLPICPQFLLRHVEHLLERISALRLPRAICTRNPYRALLLPRHDALRRLEQFQKLPMRIRALPEIFRLLNRRLCHLWVIVLINIEI